MSTKPGDDQLTGEVDERVAGEAFFEIGPGAEGDDLAVLDGEEAVGVVEDFGAGGRVFRDAQKLRTIDIQGHKLRSCARVATAITSGSLPGMPGMPIGQVRRAVPTPSAWRRERKRARLVREPISPTKAAGERSAAAVRR